MRGGPELGAEETTRPVMPSLGGPVHPVPRPHQPLIMFPAAHV